MTVQRSQDDVFFNIFIWENYMPEHDLWWCRSFYVLPLSTTERNDRRAKTSLDQKEPNLCMKICPSQWVLPLPFHWKQTVSLNHKREYSFSHLPRDHVIPWKHSNKTTYMYEKKHFTQQLCPVAMTAFSNTLPIIGTASVRHGLRQVCSITLSLCTPFVSFWYAFFAFSLEEFNFPLTYENTSYLFSLDLRE